MTDPASAAREWAKTLPQEFARRLAQALRQGPAAVGKLAGEAVLAESTAAARNAIKVAEAGDGPYLSGYLTAVLDVAALQPIVTPVWTGPESQRPGGRLTLAVLADLISEAREQLLLVSYATFPDAQMQAALRAAVDRRVEVTMLLERRADNSQFSGRDDPFPDLPGRRLYWPATARPPSAAMHAKLLVVDRRTALVGSANLTGAGLERNIECGVLIRGGVLPGALQDHVMGMEGLGEL